MEQTDWLTRISIQSGNIWTLKAIAMKTGQGKIIQGGWSIMLAGDDVVNLKWQLVFWMRYSAILATILRPRPISFRTIRFTDGAT